ncbi:MAG: FtsK/SpoIIIE domain-containing protein [Mariprofundaceae bacterium]|nr:FtsK/SpoIIIE domain-containing protein [Mariprofundaceae bacterium]
MSEVFTSKNDEDAIDEIVKHGLHVSYKWMVLRIALAKSMAMQKLPNGAFDVIAVRGSEYRLRQVTGVGREADIHGEHDFNDVICAMLSVLHGKDLFADEKSYHRFLQRHIRRGLDEIRRSWGRKDNFYDYMYQEFFSFSDQVVVSEVAVGDDQLVGELQHALGLSAELQEVITGYRLRRFVLRFTHAGDLESLRKGREKLCFQLGLNAGSLTVTQAGEPLTAWLDQPLPKTQWKSIHSTVFREWIKEGEGQVTPMTMWLGVDVLGVPFTFDLDQAPHVLVAGTTGSGKSVCIHAMLLSLLWRLPPAQLQLCLIDPKRMDYSHYEGIPHLYQQKVITEVDQAMATLQTLVENMEERSRVFARYGYLSFADVLADQNVFVARLQADQPSLYKADELLSYLLVCIDELADLIMQEPEVEVFLVRLAQKGRAMGIRLILATQRPDAKTFTGKLRSNIPARIALAVQTSAESKIILDETGAKDLLKPGDMLVRYTAGVDIVRVHGVEIKVEDIAACVSYWNRKKE